MVLATRPAARELLYSVAQPSTALCLIYFHLITISVHFSISAICRSLSLSLHELGLYTKLFCLICLALNLWLNSPLFVSLANPTLVARLNVYDFSGFNDPCGKFMFSCKNISLFDLCTIYCHCKH